MARTLETCWRIKARSCADSRKLLKNTNEGNASATASGTRFYRRTFTCKRRYKRVHNNFSGNASNSRVWSVPMNESLLKRLKDLPRRKIKTINGLQHCIWSTKSDTSKTRKRRCSQTIKRWHCRCRICFLKTTNLPRTANFLIQQRNPGKTRWFSIHRN